MTSLEVGQQIYTPASGGDLPAPGERPYAGWLYGRASVRIARRRALTSYDLTLGVTGPASLAERAQRAFHVVAGFRSPVGWDHQLPTELAGGVGIAQSWYLAPAGALGRVVGLVPGVDARLGTLKTSAGASFQARLGPRPGPPWLDSAPSRHAPYGFVEARGEAVVRDLFLDGTVFRNSVHVEHRPWVPEYQVGVAWPFNRLVLEYRATVRGREYAAGRSSHAVGSITLSWILR